MTAPSTESLQSSLDLLDRLECVTTGGGVEAPGRAKAEVAAKTAKKAGPEKAVGAGVNAASVTFLAVAAEDLTKMPFIKLKKHLFEKGMVEL